MIRKQLRGVLRNVEWLEPYNPKTKLGRLKATIIHDRSGIWKDNSEITLSGPMYYNKGFGSYIYIGIPASDYYFIYSKKNGLKTNETTLEE